MIRKDGTYSYYKLQHRISRGWCDSALAHFLFNDLSFEESRGETGDSYRQLLAPQSPCSDLWQVAGIHGFVHLEDAEAMLDALREANPGRTFRIVHVTITQTTTPVAVREGRAA